MKIEFEKEILDWLNLPSIPKKRWDESNPKSFKNGVAVVTLVGGRKAYAVATFDVGCEQKPRIKKVFSCEPYSSIDEIFIVPNYMDEDIESFDMDEESKKAAQRLLDEAHDLEMEGVEEEKIQMPNNEYFFSNIHNDEEAIAFIKEYNRSNRIKGRIPTDHETILMKLSVMWANAQKGNNKRNKRK